MPYDNFDLETGDSASTTVICFAGFFMLVAIGLFFYWAYHFDEKKKLTRMDLTVACNEVLCTNGYVEWGKESAMITRFHSEKWPGFKQSDFIQGR